MQKLSVVFDLLRDFTPRVRREWKQKMCFAEDSLTMKTLPLLTNVQVILIVSKCLNTLNERLLGGGEELSEIEVVQKDPNELSIPVAFQLSTTTN